MMDWSECPDPYILEAADDFADGARAVSPPANMRCVRSYFVMSCFAIELYLKSLNAEVETRPVPGVPGAVQLGSKSRKRGHSLVALFDALDQHIKDDIERLYGQAAPAGASQFRTALEPYDRVFEKFRYSFELDNAMSGLNVTQLARLLSTLRAFSHGSVDPESA